MEVFSFPDGSQLVREANGTVYVIPPSMGGASLVDCDQATEKLQDEQKAIVEALGYQPSVDLEDIMEEHLWDLNMLPTECEDMMKNSWLYGELGENKFCFFDKFVHFTVKNMELDSSYNSILAELAFIKNTLIEDMYNGGNGLYGLSNNDVEDVDNYYENICLAEAKFNEWVYFGADDVFQKLNDLLPRLEENSILPDSLISICEGEYDRAIGRMQELQDSLVSEYRQGTITLAAIDVYANKAKEIRYSVSEIYQNVVVPLSSFEYWDAKDELIWSPKEEGQQLFDEFMTLCGFKAQELLDESPEIFWTGFNENDGKVSIPEEVNGHEVDSINGLIFPPYPNNIKGKRLKSSGGCIVEIPSTVEAIQGDPFRGYSGKIIMNPSMPPKVLGNGFTENTLWGCVLIVPDEAVSAYKSAPVWSGFPTIRSFTQASVDGITVDSDTEGSAIYYTIDGKKVSSPLDSGIYIKILNGKTSKISR